MGGIKDETKNKERSHRRKRKVIPRVRAQLLPNCQSLHRKTPIQIHPLEVRKTPGIAGEKPYPSESSSQQQRRASKHKSSNDHQETSQSSKNAKSLRLDSARLRRLSIRRRRAWHGLSVGCTRLLRRCRRC